MKKGQITRKSIVEAAAPLFMARGYSGVSMSQVMQATGLQKGGLYNHFRSKEELALATFDFAMRIVRRRFVRALIGKVTVQEQLDALIGVMVRYYDDPPVPGGCPVLNSGLQNRGVSPELVDRARAGIGELQAYIREVVKAGISSGEVDQDVDPAAVASIFISILEGALSVSLLEKDRTHLERAESHLHHWLSTIYLS